MKEPEELLSHVRSIQAPFENEMAWQYPGHYTFTKRREDFAKIVFENQQRMSQYFPSTFSGIILLSEKK